MGSHVETQPHAGWLDGALGVIYGLEVARASGGGIDVAAWADEEGHFGSFIGSRSFCGLLPEAEIDTLHNREGTTLRDALVQAGFAGRPRAQVDPARYRRLYRGAYRAGRRTGGHRQAHRRRDGDRRQPPLPHPVRWRAEPRRHDAHGDPQGCRCGAGAAGGGDLRRFPEVCGPRTVWTTGASRSIQVRPVSCRAAPRWCSSSATPIRRCCRSSMASWRR